MSRRLGSRGQARQLAWTMRAWALRLRRSNSCRVNLGRRGRRPGGWQRTEFTKSDESEDEGGEGDRRRRGIKAGRRRSDWMRIYFFRTRTPRERKEAGTMPDAARGAASPWFTESAQKPADGEVSLNIV